MPEPTKGQQKGTCPTCRPCTLCRRDGCESCDRITLGALCACGMRLVSLTNDGEPFGLVKTWAHA